MNSDSMPPVSNWPLYIYRVLMKWLSFFIFGLGTMILVIVCMPVMMLIFHPRQRFQTYARRLVSLSFRSFVFFMWYIGVVKLETADREAFKKLGSTIVVANHPSLLDVVMMISLIPNADVIVRGNLIDNVIIRGVIRRLYIRNTLDFETLAKVCGESLAQGNCIVIFPEGTRTPRCGPVRLKKGAARLSLLLGAEIVAVRIGGTDKYGLGKHDPAAAFNHTEKYIYKVGIVGRLKPENYQGMEMPRAVRHMNTEIFELLLPGVSDSRIADSQTKHLE